MNGWSEEKPPRRKPKLKAAPRLREIYYCDFWKDAQLPEFWKQRPVVIVSRNRDLHGVCTVIPLTSDPQPQNKRAYLLTTRINDRQSWAICNHPQTIAVSRLSIVKPKTPRITQEELYEIIKILSVWLPISPIQPS